MIDDLNGELVGVEGASNALLAGLDREYCRYLADPASKDRAGLQAAYDEISEEIGYRRLEGRWDDETEAREARVSRLFADIEREKEWKWPS